MQVVNWLVSFGRIRRNLEKFDQNNYETYLLRQSILAPDCKTLSDTQKLSLGTRNWFRTRFDSNRNYGKWKLWKSIVSTKRIPIINGSRLLWSCLVTDTHHKKWLIMRSRSYDEHPFWCTHSKLSWRTATGWRATESVNSIIAFQSPWLFEKHWISFGSAFLRQIHSRSD